MKFTKEHEWIKIADDNVATIGITEFAKDQLGNLVYVELPQVGKQLEQGNEAAVVESVKAASEIYAPISGEVIEVNEAIIDDPSLIDSAPHDEGWFFKIKASNPAECDSLMDTENYNTYIKGC